MKRQLFDIFRRAVEWGEKVPWRLRTLLGIALDVPPWRRRLLNWPNEKIGHASAR